MKIYIVRHVQTESNVGNKLLGLVDEDINSVGHCKLYFLELNRF